MLDEWFTRQGYSSKDSEFDLIYVNGGNSLENLKQPDDTRNVRLIEEGFRRAAHIIEDTYYTQRVEHLFLEPEACIAIPLVGGLSEADGLSNGKGKSASETPPTGGPRSSGDVA